jgi:hypothetical protein
MARPFKKIVQTSNEVIQEVVLEPTKPELNLVEENLLNLIYQLQGVIAILEGRVVTLEKKLEKPEGKSINRIEAHSGEVASTIESYNGLKMDESDKVQSMVNAIKILPPNMIVKGRHLKENVEAICGFKVDDEMMDEAYKGIVHDYQEK